MTSMAIPTMVTIGLVVLAVNIALCIARAILGPSPFDRIMALEAVTFNVSGAVVLVSLKLRTGSFAMDLLLVVALLGFIGTVALASYAEGDLGA